MTTRVTPIEARPHLRCEVCGIPWEQHTDDCPRHAVRYLHECLGHGRAGAWACCDRPGAVDAEAWQACPNGCPCHERAGEGD